MSNRQRRILEAMAPVGPVIQPTLGESAPKEVHQCEVCSGFILTTEDEPTLPGSCPICGATPLKTTHYGTVDTQTEPTKKEIVQREPAVTGREAERIISEAVELLESGQTEKFSNTFRNITALNKKGELVAVVESSVARKRLTAKQRSTYRLSEKIVKESTVNKNRIKAVRLNAFLINEARNIKRRAQLSSIYEGLDNDPKALEDGIDKELETSDYTDYIEDILGDEKVIDELVDDKPENAVSQLIKEVIEDAGLEVLSSEVIDEDNDSTVISTRVIDKNEVDFHTSQLEEAVSAIVDGDVSIDGVSLPGASGEVMDLEVVVQNSDTVIEDEFTDIADEEFEAEEIYETTDEDEEDEDLDESFKGRVRRIKPKRSTNRGILEGKEEDISGTVEICDDEDLSKQDVIEMASALIENDIDAEFTNGTLVVEYESKGELEDVLDILDEVTGDEEVVAEYCIDEDVFIDDNDEDDLDESDEEDVEEEDTNINEFLQRVNRLNKGNTKNRRKRQ